MLQRDCRYINADQREALENLVDKMDVTLGAMFEVYINNFDIKELAHSILIFLKEKGFADATDYEFIKSQENRALNLFIRIKEAKPSFQSEEIFKDLSRSSHILERYLEIVEFKSQESPELLIKLGDQFTQDWENMKTNEETAQKRFTEFKAVKKELSPKEMKDNIRILMMEHAQELISQDADIYKAVMSNLSEKETTDSYTQIEHTNINAKLVEILNSLIETFFVTTFKQNNFQVLQIMLDHKRSWNQINRVYAALTSENVDEKVKTALADVADFAQMGEDMEVLDCIDMIFK